MGDSYMDDTETTDGFIRTKKQVDKTTGTPLLSVALSTC
mgnify:FL=1